MNIEHHDHHQHHPQGRATHPAWPAGGHGDHFPVAPGERGSHDQHAGHDKPAGHSVAMFRKKFWISLALTIPTLLWGHMLARLTGRNTPLLPGGRWIAPRGLSQTRAQIS